MIRRVAIFGLFALALAGDPAVQALFELFTRQQGQIDKLNALMTVP